MSGEAHSAEVVVDLQGDLTGYPLPDDAAVRLRDVIVATLQRVALTGWYEVSLVLTDDRAVQRVNRRHRGIDKPTDVLSFPQSDAPLVSLPTDEAWTAHAFGDDTHAAPVAAEVSVADPNAAERPHRPALAVSHDYGTADDPYLLGDIMISVPTVVRQAADTRQSAWYELCFLISHGILHLIGYDDYYEPGYHAMVAHQRAVLTALAIS